MERKGQGHRILPVNASICCYFFLNVATLTDSFIFPYVNISTYGCIFLKVNTNLRLHVPDVDV
jgi:hypothetical protein